jgi:7-keto-8-aminopelargonate synthetase-like enzyme
MIVLSGAIGNFATVNGKTYSYFGGNNYLGLANHPLIKEAASKAIEKYGVNFSASRQTTGTADIHLELERGLSLFKGKDDSAVFASGYLGNSILIEVLRGGYSAIFIDESAHASIISAIRGEKASVYNYRHCDANHLGDLLQEHGGHLPLVITDGIFALTGEIAPLDKIYPLVKRHNGILVVDDAHATGILGKTGKGTPEHFSLQAEKNIYQTETMSKAMGGFGGFIAGSRELTDLIRQKSATYQASTALPPPVVAAGIASLKVLSEHPELRTDVLSKATWLREQVVTLGFRTTGNNTPIIPLFFDAPENAKSISLYLGDNGIIVPFMNYPVRHELHMIRITVSAAHTAGQSEVLLNLLKKWKLKYGNI